MDKMEELYARNLSRTENQFLRDSFSSLIKEEWVVEGLFINSSYSRVIGVAKIDFVAPVTMELFKNSELSDYLIKTVGLEASLLIINCEHNNIKIFLKDEIVKEVEVPEQIKMLIANILSSVANWAGTLNEKGEHVINLKTPSPGPHFNVNLLMGNRIGYEHPLQTTPKSVLDRFGRGSFRSHAATQVLATRWDLRQEENGFPANRQFYILENNKKIFYSGDMNDDNITSAFCNHSQNSTTIIYKTKCGLEIKSLIFILPQEEGMPLATEVMQLHIKNLTKNKRQLKILTTGMFGSAAPGALQEDVLYSNITMQTKLLKTPNGGIMAIAPDYYRDAFKEDKRFYTMLIKNGEKVKLPQEFCADYNEFVGNGTLENPQGMYKLSNRLKRKGPGFFAMEGTIVLTGEESAKVSCFTGLVSNKSKTSFAEASFTKEISHLIEVYSKEAEVEKALEKTKAFYENYSKFIKFKTSDKIFNTYVNNNLPFQVLYQTFVSRSFCQTQKGYREIGFREIQDLYSSMYYFINMGMGYFVKQLIIEWSRSIFRFGFTYHNFFWEGKEAGKWSDDGLWFVQAVYRYIKLSGDIGILYEKSVIAGTKDLESRTIYETLQAIISYSGEISVGKHGLPLLDFADWNDCLKIDGNYMDGRSKEKLYEKQLSKGGKYGDPLLNNNSESVMNAFLLKVAIDDTEELAQEIGDFKYETKLQLLSEKLLANIQKYAWKENFFARVLLNKYATDGFTYLGAKGDNLSADSEIDGTYFLNSFSWSILSGCASEEKIELMFVVVKKILRNSYGLKLVSRAELSKISNTTASGEYFPGDRENGAVFKHASMMATAALFKAAKEVDSDSLALELSRLAYWMIDLTLPYKTMENPFIICGSPRFCTQYTNSETGESIGPMLSGTATWLTLSLLSAFGIECSNKSYVIDPILREEEEKVILLINFTDTVYEIKITKPVGFYRFKGGNLSIRIDGKVVPNNIITISQDKKKHSIEVVMI